MQGAVFRANIAHNRINSETGEVVVNMQWYQVSDGGGRGQQSTCNGTRSETGEVVVNMQWYQVSDG